MSQTIDIHIQKISPLLPPRRLTDRIPLTAKAEKTILEGREQVRRIIHGEDDRLLVLVGPCSIHDPEAAIEYSERLIGLAKAVKENILIVMRAYFEKPRTTLGWKGFINDPRLNGTFDVAEGMEKARRFLMHLAESGMPAATEWLDLLTPQYFGDLISWGAIGARTTESQSHRQLASGLSSTIGFKNGTGGNIHSIQIAVNGVVAARSSHAFISTNLDGAVSVVITKGNPDTHIILRGGSDGPNYDEASVKTAQELLEKAGLKPLLMVDCSHGNSNKDHRRQSVVLKDLLEQRLKGNRGIAGIMLESHLKEGNQKLSEPSVLEYGVSITDACIGWETTEALLLEVSNSLTNHKMRT